VGILFLSYPLEALLVLSLSLKEFLKDLLDLFVVLELAKD
jgi:hypothetical protein